MWLRIHGSVADAGADSRATEKPATRKSQQRSDDRNAMNLTCYRIGPDAPELVPGRAERTWMDATGQRFAYRCTPLTMANSTGWELLCPTDIQASWTGGPGISDLVVENAAPGHHPGFVHSHFGHGVLSFHPGYLFRTDARWALWCRGVPNMPKDGIAALDGLVETDWLPFTFTMNWLFTRPGTIRFSKGEPFCFILPVPHLDIETIRPTIVPLSDNPELQAQHAAWGSSRAEFNRRLGEKDPVSVREKWQRFYFKGQSPNGPDAPQTHRVKRKMHLPDAGSSGLNAAGANPPAATASLAPVTAGTCRQNIIWIASYPKSGNTWVRAFLHNLIRELSGDADQAQDINRMNEHTVWEIPAKPYERALGKSLSAASRSEIAEIRPEIQRRLANSRSSPFFMKTHLCHGSDQGHPTINLNATRAAIYIIRNPLDVAISYAHHTGIGIDATIANMGESGLRTPGSAQDVHEVLSSWSENVAGWIGLTDRPVYVMRYEDLLSDPVRPFGALARFLRLEPDERQLQAAIAKSSFSELSRQEQERGFNERPPTARTFFREGRAGQWRDVLSPAQVRQILQNHAPMMQKFGYLPPDSGTSIEIPRRSRDIPGRP